jgi:hypothetical protein
MVDAGVKMVDAGVKVVDAGVKVVDAGVKVVDAGVKVVDAGVKVVDAGVRKQDVSGWMSCFPVAVASEPSCISIKTACGRDRCYVCGVYGAIVEEAVMGQV